LRVHDRFYLDHVKGWNTFSDTNDEFHLGLNGFEDSISSKWWWNINNRCISLSSVLGLSNVSENWKIKMSSASLSLVDSTNNIGSVFNGLFGMEGSVFTGHSLDENLGVFIDENVRLGLLGVYTSLESVNKALSLSSIESSGQNYLTYLKILKLNKKCCPELSIELKLRALLTLSKEVYTPRRPNLTFSSMNTPRFSSKE
jgi:hypothetical protein